jgi:hypothetical protein
MGARAAATRPAKEPRRETTEGKRCPSETSDSPSTKERRRARTIRPSAVVARDIHAPVLSRMGVGTEIPAAERWRSASFCASSSAVEKASLSNLSR